MLLRSASTPILKSSSPRASPEPDPVIRIKPTRSLKPVSSSPTLPKTTSDGNLRRLHVSISEKKSVLTSQGRSELVLEKNYGGGGSGGGSGGGGYGDWGKGSESMDVYYQKMIQAYPDDPLVLGNYAKFLKEVRGDVVKAEEYCERAILANPDEGNVLSLYGDLIWCNHKDVDRAQTYFDQAVNSAPDDCYVLASYARFLWDAEEEEEEEEFQDKYTNSSTEQRPSFLPPLTAAS